MTISDGFAAECVATRELSREGYEIIARNYHCRQGEIDIVARQADTLVFCEVKQRTSGRESALLSVSARKQRRLVLAALHFLSTHPELDGLPTRFDVIVVVPERGRWKVEHLVDAFRP